VAPTARKEQAARDGDEGDQLGGLVDLLLQWARLGSEALRQSRDPPQLGGHRGGVDDPLGLTRGAKGSREDEVV
jgi:hypothetical protein